MSLENSEAVGGDEVKETSAEKVSNDLPNLATTKTDGAGEEDGKKTEDRRLWIGNLNPKLTEGYAFITYQSSDAAQKCLQNLDGKRILDRTMSIRYAHQATYAYGDEEERLRKKLPALGMKAEAESKSPLSKERAISAIEAKLRAMEREKDEMDSFCLTAVGTSQKLGASKSQSNSVRPYPYASKSSGQIDSRTRGKPYSRFPPKRRH